MIFRNNLRLIRQGLGKSQEEFGKLIGATEGMIQTYEGGRNMPKTLVLTSLSALTGLTVDKLISEELKLEDIEGIKKTFARKSKESSESSDNEKPPAFAGANDKLVKAYERIIELQEQQSTVVDFEKTVIKRLVNIEASNRVLLRLFAEQIADRTGVPVGQLLKKYEGALMEETENLFSSL